MDEAREKRLLRLNAGSDLGSWVRLQSCPFGAESWWILQMSTFRKKNTEISLQRSFIIYIKTCGGGV